MGAYQGYHLAYWGWLSATPPVHFLPVQARKMIIDRGSKMGMDFAAEIKALYEVDWPSEPKQASWSGGQVAAVSVWLQLGLEGPSCIPQRVVDDTMEGVQVTQHGSSGAACVIEGGGERRLELAHGSMRSCVAASLAS